MYGSPQPVYCFAGEPPLIYSPRGRRLDCPLTRKEEPMRILGNSLNIQSINLYAASQSERTAAAAQRASEVRKRLLKSARSVVADPDPDASLLIGQWLDSRH